MPNPYYADELVTLYHGDCLEVTEWLAADVLVTDPPYGVSYNSQKVRGRHWPIANDEDTSARDTVLDQWGGKPSVVFGSWRQARPSGTKQLLIWDKGDYVGMGDITIPWGNSHEEIYVLGDWPPILPGGRMREGGSPARVGAVLRSRGFNTQSGDKPDHPTPKPIGLMESLIGKTVGTVADPFAGSGATLIAARNLGRPSIGVELEERYCELIAKRLSQQVFDFGTLTGTP